MSYNKSIISDFKEERKKLKQKLFTIRRFVEGESVKMDSELKELKKRYESLPNFTNWSDFPEKWDIGDPNKVKEHSFAFNEIDELRHKKTLGQSYETIVSFIEPEIKN